MPRIFLHALAVLAAQAAPAGAQPTAPTPEQVAERIDHYRFNPREPDTYRALAGLGDPALPPGTGSFATSQAGEALLARMLPNQQPIDDYWYPRPGVCRTDYALSVAQARVARFGANHPYVEQWLRAQRVVFTPCQRAQPWGPAETTPRGPSALPPAMATADPEIARLQRDDRAYQAASLLFYRGDARAPAAFAAIARSASPHAHVSRYMVVAAEVGDNFPRWSEEPDPDRNARAHRILAAAQAILADPSLRDIHPLAQGLIGFVGYHIGDAQSRAAQVDATLDALETPLPRIRSDPVAADRYERAEADIPWLHRRFDDPAWWLTGAVPTEMTASRAMAEAARTRPLAAFLLFPVARSERAPWAAQPRQHNGAWSRLSEHADAQAGHETGEAWALIQSSLADVYDPDGWAAIDALVRDTQAQPTDRRLAAVAARFYHQVRRALMHVSVPEERDQAFRAALSRVEAWPWRESAHHRTLLADMLQYLIARGRLAEARLLRDRTNPRGEAYYRVTVPMLLLLAEDEDHLAREIAAQPEGGQELLNLLSTNALARLAAREELPRPIRARFARVAWTRLYALRRRIPERLDRQMRALNPEITAQWTSRPGARADSRPLLLDVLRSPGLNIVIADHQRTSSESASYVGAPDLVRIDTFEHSDNNWWCAWQPQRHSLRAAAAMYDSFLAPDEERWNDRDPLAAAGAPAALGPLLRSSYLWNARDEAELAGLAAIPSAPQRLAEAAVAWRGSGSRDHQDEALALAVRATRYGCQRQGGHGAWSRAAHALLHQRFPTSPAAARTRWWFDCSHFSVGCDGTRIEDPELWQHWAGRIYWSVSFQ
ncbi:MAG: hypothetical protein QOI38_233 [Sphingomonadales bacterium]|jgi:hypothetical protein|nr:hypothetical protein [Sphingomonadales bacterium]